MWDVAKGAVTLILGIKVMADSNIKNLNSLHYLISTTQRSQDLIFELVEEM